LGDATQAQGAPSPPAIQLRLDGKPAYLIDEAALVTMRRVTVRAALPGGPVRSWQGVALEDIVRRTCVASDDALAGRALARFVRVSGADGSQVVFSAAELDDDFGGTAVILADRVDGQPLTNDGPFRLIVPHDRRGDRSMAQVTTVEVVDASTP